MHPLPVILTASFGAAAEDRVLKHLHYSLSRCGLRGGVLRASPVGLLCLNLMPSARPLLPENGGLVPSRMPPQSRTPCLLPGTGARSPHTAADTTASFSASTGPPPPVLVGVGPALPSLGTASSPVFSGSPRPQILLSCWGPSAALKGPPTLGQFLSAGSIRW